MGGAPPERPRHQAAGNGTSVRDHVVRTLIRCDFDGRLAAAAEETERFYGVVGPQRLGSGAQVSPRAGISQ
ncbi:ribbon-helix-helix protein, CopG family [Streptomyces sp. PRKS01-65]|nr:ribbon-helix-helix protein, CopG family [Streptomyces harenosi]NEY32813.1 ribbon-helix-helix protein, CopG family [Streptomyces harenosi]